MASATRYIQLTTVPFYGNPTLTGRVSCDLTDDWQLDEAQATYNALETRHTRVLNASCVIICFGVIASIITLSIGVFENISTAAAVGGFSAFGLLICCGPSYFAKRKLDRISELKEALEECRSQNSRFLNLLKQREIKQISEREFLKLYRAYRLHSLLSGRAFSTE